LIQGGSIGSSISDILRPTPGKVATLATILMFSAAGCYVPHPIMPIGGLVNASHHKEETLEIQSEEGKHIVKGMPKGYETAYLAGDAAGDFYLLIRDKKNNNNHPARMFLFVGPGEYLHITNLGNITEDDGIGMTNIGFNYMGRDGTLHIPVGGQDGQPPSVEYEGQERRELTELINSGNQ